MAERQAHTHSTKKARVSGFTIVELLIVIVVIGILAAITIVAFNGVSNQAKSVAAKSAAAQAVKKVITYAVTNNDDYPASLSLAGISDTDTNYQYRVDNSVSPKTFCVTATTNSVSAWVSNTSTTPTLGACATHGLNGKVAITNYVPNPRLKTDFSYYYAQTPAGNTTARSTNEGPSGEPTFNVTTASTGQLRIDFRYSAAAVPVTAGEQITASIYFYSPHSITTAGFEMQWNTGWSLYNFGSIQSGWSRYSVTATVPTGVTALNDVQLLTTGSANTGQTFKATKAMVTKTSTLETYGDGDSPGWAWSGTGNAVVSTGTQL